MYEEDKEALVALMVVYSIKDIVKALSDLSLNKSSEMIDLELHDAAKLWTETSLILDIACDSLKL